MNALVCFHDHGAQWTARFLKPGFKHVFVALPTDRGWIAVEGAGTTPTVKIVCALDYDLAAFYREHGFTVVETSIDTSRKYWPRLIAGTCLGLVKVCLGIGKPWIVTPRQLHRHLTKGR